MKVAAKKTINCVLCDTTFESNVSHSKYCGPDCAKKAQRGKDRIRRELEKVVPATGTKWDEGISGKYLSMSFNGFLEARHD